MKGYAKAKIIDPNPKKIVRKLNCIRIKNAKAHSSTTYIKEWITEILFEAIGLFFVLSTFLSKSLSTISLNIQPALHIKIEPKKNKIKWVKNILKFKSIL